MTDPRDVALHASCPTVAVPRFGQLPEMEYGQRLLIAANGVFLQVRTGWLDALLPLGELPVELPYGRIEPRLSFSFGKIAGELLSEFVAAARDALPNEVAAGLVYSHGSNTLRLVRYSMLRQSPDLVNYQMPPLASDENVAVDLHSHGYDAAYFSATDDIDDLGIKIAGVFGNLDLQSPTIAFRLVVGRARWPLPCPAMKFEAGEKTWNT